jgi:hypothetical protein
VATRGEIANKKTTDKWRKAACCDLAEMERGINGGTRQAET